MRARYLAERREIAARYAEWEITGSPEIRDVDPEARYFSPWVSVLHPELMRPQEDRDLTVALAGRNVSPPPVVRQFGPVSDYLEEPMLCLGQAAPQYCRDPPPLHMLGCPAGHSGIAIEQFEEWL